MKKIAKISICIALGLAVAGGVCAGLVFNNQAQKGENLHEEYAAVQEWAQKTKSGRGAVEKFLNAEAKSAKLSDEEKLVVENFEKAVPDDTEMQNVLKKLKDATDDETIEKKADEVALSYIDLRALYLVEKDLSVMYDGELSDDDLVQLGKSENQYLITLANDISSYRTKVKELKAKDKDFEKKYKSLLEEGEKLQKKYAKIKLEDLIGKKNEEILLFYDKLDELDKLLEEGKK